MAFGRLARAAAVGGSGASGVTAAALLAQASPEIFVQLGPAAPLAAMGYGAYLAFVPGALAGLAWSGAQHVLRRRSARALPPDPLGGGVWRDAYDACAEHASRFRDVVDSIPAGAAHDWLDDIAADVGAELHDAYALAELGQRVAPTSGQFVPRAGAPLDIHRRLSAAEDRFAEAADDVGAVALALLDDRDPARVKTQLEALREVAPTLRQVLRRESSDASP